MPKVPKTTTITIRAIEEDKLRWIDKARRAGMSLTSYISYVMIYTDLKVCLSTGPEAPISPSDGSRGEEQPGGGENG